MSEKWTEPDLEAEALAEGFFSQPDAVLQADAESWEAAPMSSANRRAMLATLGLLGGCTVAGLVFALLSEHVMVAPAELGGVESHEALASWSAPATAPAPVFEPAPTPEPEPELAMAPATALTAATPQPAPEPLAQPTAVEPAPEPTRPMQLSAKASPPRSRPRMHQAAPPTTGPEGAAEQLTQRAYRELGQGRAREAEQLASRALVEDGTRAGTYIVLAGARDALGDRDGALAAIRSCVKRATDRLATTCKTLAR